MAVGGAIIIGFYCLGELTHQYLHLPIPGSVIGMILLFLYLIFQADISDSLQRNSQLLIKILPLLLIPSSAGVITCISLLEKEGIAIAATLSISIVFSIILSAWILSLLSQRYNPNSRQ
jgi:holin-like protein